MAEQDLGQDLGWDGYLVDDGDNYELLDPGYYPFRVKKLTKERFEGSDKMAACSRAKLTLEVTVGDHTATIIDRLMLNTKRQWVIIRFFESLGFTRDAEGRMQMHWNEIDDKEGWLKIKQRTYKGKDGSDKVTNDVEEYCRPSDAAKAYAEWASRYEAPQNQQAPAAAPQQTAMPVPQQPQHRINPTTGGSWSL